MKKLASFITATMLSLPATAGMIVSQTDFSDTSAWQLNGDATQNNDRLVLTQGLSQSGSAFLSSSINLLNDTSFSAFFTFEISQPVGLTDVDGIQGADGLVFVVQTNDTNVGSQGLGIGYQGIANSLGIEFDTWTNTTLNDIDGNHVGINLGGNSQSVAQASESDAFNTGGIWSAWIDYNGINDLLEVRWSNTGTRSSDAGLSLNVDLANELGSSDAFFGFTSGTAAGGGLHEIVSFEFRNDFAPISAATAIDAPPAIALMLAGLIGIGYRRKVK
ncbi:L-type lectin-domain containing protein [Thalassotalea montiporae]